MADLRPLVERLGHARTSLLSVVEQIAPEQWNQRPEPNCWSAAEVVAHLNMVEAAVLKGMQKLLATEPRPVPFWKRVHIPPIVNLSRLVKVKTPIPLDPALLAEKEKMLARFSALRSETLALLEANRERDLRRWRFPHPFFGSLNGVGWIKMLAYHEARHTKQMREIAGSLGS
ncbi:MAG: DinB family protein [Candidatus Acidiferrales bacterium]